MKGGVQINIKNICHIKMFQVRSLKHNFIMYTIRTLLNVIFGIIIFPYIARTLGPSGVGKIQYAESIVAYFLLFINLGMAHYGKREVAFFRDDKIELSKIVIELLCILLINTIIGIVVYFFLVNKIQVFRNEKIIFYIFSFNIIFNFLGVEWFYEGIENQTYITNRNIVFKIISGVAILLFVKKNIDLDKYVIILVFSLVGSNLLNFIELFKYLKIKEIKVTHINIKRHLKPLSILFFYVLSLSISYNLDSIMIRKFIGVTEVGYYSFANKMSKIPTILTGAIVAIFYPRLCNLIQKSRYIEYISLTKKALNIILLISIPSAIGMYCISDLIVKIFAGEEFVDSIPIMQIFSIYVFIISMAMFTGSITLLVNKMESIFMFSSLIGSIFNFVFNINFIPKLGAVGAAIATLITEGTAIGFRLLLAKKLFKKIKIFELNHIKIFVSSIIIIPITILIKKLEIDILWQLLLTVVTGGIGYIIILLVLQEKITIQIFQNLKIKFFK